ncbi:hypothetical protein [Chiayiivirga sp.]|uniref:hypothetical protein n=1 Tax=Chiayiivirga sp. TaxID=2041042 RepID=UPI003DA853E3
MLDSDANGDFVAATIGSESTYRVRVVNRGEATAQNVRVREFIPKSSGQISPRVIACLASTSRPRPAPVRTAP